MFLLALPLVGIGVLATGVAPTALSVVYLAGVTPWLVWFDVKLGAALGLASWDLSVAILSPAAAFFTGGLVSVILLITGRRGRNIAFGPFLLGGFWTAVLAIALARPWR
jgi:hypothetical protein